MIITIIGPTGVGKTALSLILAKKYNAEVINADSTQIYKEMNIGTAKIIDYENITHHLINIKNLNEPYTIYEYQKDGRKIIDDLKSKNKNIIIVGGSGLYISALLYDYKFTENKLKTDENISIDKMIEKLNKLNIKIDINNNQQIKRKYNKYIVNKEKINNKEPKLLYDTLIIGLTTPRDNLYNIINKRTDKMLENNLLKEVEKLNNKYKDNKQLNSTIGYKELISYLEKKISYEEAINKIKQNSRRYAKRQYTWFNNKMNVKWFNTNYEDFNQTVKEIEEYIKTSL